MTGVVDDRIWGGNDNDTFWGGEGNDIIEGGDGADIALGGEGNDIITDLAGDDVPKGGPGNDAIDAGPGLDIIMGGDGNDFTNGGANINETFGGARRRLRDRRPGPRRRLRRQRRRLAGGWRPARPPDRRQLQPVLRRPQPARPRHPDRPGRRRRLRPRGWRRHRCRRSRRREDRRRLRLRLGDRRSAIPQAAGHGPGVQVFVAGGVLLPGVRDKFNEVEALSGWNLNDILRGDSIVPTAVGGGGFVGCDALDAGGRRPHRGPRRPGSRTLRTVDSATDHRRLGDERTACSPATSGAMATSSSAAPAATSSRVAAPTTSSTATSTSTSG